MNGPVIIETDRLVLREMTEDDRKAVHAYMSLRETVSFSSYDPWTEDEARDFVSRAIRSLCSWWRRGVRPPCTWKEVCGGRSGGSWRREVAQECH